jgi:hypothetical protein
MEKVMTSSNNMLFAAGLLDKGVLVDLNPEMTDQFLRDIDVEKLFAVNEELKLPQDLDKAVTDARSALEVLHYGLVQAAIASKRAPSKK